MALGTVFSTGIKFLQTIPAGFLAPCVTSAATNFQTVRHRRTKHVNPKFKMLRARKVVKMELPDFDENKKNADMSPEEMRSKMKEKGIQPPRPWMERPFYISCTGGVFEPYVPPEGDGKLSAISKQGAKQKFEFLEKKSKSMMAIRKIRSFDEDFEQKDFVNLAQDIYIKAHEFMMRKDKLKLREYVSEKAYPEIKHNTHDKTIHWKFIKSLEPPRIVHARCTDVISKENIFSQITVRFHTQQMLAIYDRFGRLMHGSEIVAKDVLEYVVFEKHLSNQYGTWRLHDKLIPDWMPPKEPAEKTFVVIESSEPLQELETHSVKALPSSEEGKQQPIAVAAT